MNDIITKIRKLLELSKSTNEHEAANAAARAADLMLKHQIEEADLEAHGGEAKPDPITDEAIDERGKWVSWKGWLTMGLAEAFGCETYRTLEWSNTKNKTVDAHHCVGPASALETIRYMYAYLTKEIERLADEGYKTECEERLKSGLDTRHLPPARGWKASFRAGAANTIRARLEAQRKKTRAAAKELGQTTALAIVDKHREETIAKAQILAPWNYHKKGPNKGERKYGSATYTPSTTSGWDAGQSAGRNVNLGGNKGLGSGSGNKRLS